MATGMVRQARRAALLLLKNDPALTAIVPAARWYPQTAPIDPVWPFGKTGPSTAQPFRASGVNGATVAFAVHVFARDREDEDGAVVETAEDFAGRIGEHVERVLADNRTTMDDGTVMKVWLSDFQLLADGEPGAFHWFAQVNARVLTEALTF